MNFTIHRRMAPVNYMAIVFFISGFAALIYQVVWQRVLYATFGINIESVTVIVSVFMFGLGIGSLVGGWLSARFPTHLLKIFVGIELAVALFGLVSIPLIHTVGLHTSQNSLFALIETTYALLSFPTMLMGATLPLLVAHLQRQAQSFGAVVGKLYAYNTLGSALAAFITVTLLFVYMGEQSTVITAALCNILTAFLAWRLCRRIDANIAQPENTPITFQGFSYPVALLLAAALGYVSLSCEIFWFRVIGFMTGTNPRLFGILLSFFLLGIAFGSLEARDWSLKEKDNHGFVWRALLKIAAVTYFSVPVIGLASLWLGNPAGLLTGLFSACLIGCYSGSVFPLLCNVTNKNQGASVAWIYFFNIVGATFGALTTGFVLLDIFSLGVAITIVSALLLIPIIVISFLTHWRDIISLKTRTGWTAIMVIAFSLQPILYNHIIDNLFPGFGAFKYVKENRSGIIGILADPLGDIIIGGGSYDGRFNIDPVLNSNAITRAYMVPVLHPEPGNILEIGLSGGAWARVLTLYQPLQHMTDVEINPGYVDIIKHYPDIASILQNPKVELHTDDGRRWLKRHPDTRFDVIVMNTTFYWRSNTTNLLSKEFLELAKQHLTPGGMLYYNSTGALDSVYTAAHVFQHVVIVNNFIAASDQSFDIPLEEKRKNLLSFQNEAGQPLFLASDAARNLMDKLVTQKLEDMHDSILKKENLYLITDDNMATEYKKITEFPWQ